jgi:hypothetical protein
MKRLEENFVAKLASFLCKGGGMVYYAAALYYI